MAAPNPENDLCALAKAYLDAWQEMVDDAGRSDRLFEALAEAIKAGTPEARE